MGDALQVFRGEEPSLLTFTPAAQPNRADVIENNGYFNNLSVLGSATGAGANSLTTNFITPIPMNVVPYFGDYHLGLYGVADGSNSQAVVFDLYESILNPGASVQFGVGQYTKLAICSTPPSGPFVITTSHSSVGGQLRGILIAPELVLQLGSNTTARWDIQTSSGNLVPSNGQSCELAAQSNPCIPSAATGVNGDLFWRSDGAAGTTLYIKRAGAWVAATGV